MQKLTSRKLWIAISQIVGGILIIANFSDTSAGIISGAIVSVSSAIVYMIVEGKVDANRVATIVTEAEKVATTVKEELK